MIEKIRAQSREMAARREQDRIQRRKLASERLKFDHTLSGRILSNCDSVPLEDLATRWKVSPAMLVKAAENGLFEIVITEYDEVRDHWYMSKARWPYKEKSFVVSAPNTVHTLIAAPVRFSDSLHLYFPVDEITRIEQRDECSSGGAVSVNPNWVSVKEAAAHHRRSEKTIRNWIKKSKVQSRRTPSGTPEVLLE